MARWKVSFASFLLLSFCGPAAVAVAGADPQLDSLFAAMPHASFVWTEAEGVSPRAAMRVPVRLGDREGWFQLDTGLDVSLLYGDVAARSGWEMYEGWCHLPDFRIGDMKLGPTWLLSRTEMAAEGDLLGSVGLDLLIGRVTVIDYPGCRLALMTPGEMPGWLLQKMSWTPAEVRDAKCFLTVVLGDETISGIFFDTGASAFDTLVDFDAWIKLTGCAGPDSATTRWIVKAWGHDATAFGCSARGALVIGSTRIPNPRIFYLAEQPKLFAGWPFPATGLVGCAPFWDHTVVLDLGIRPRFGVME